VVRLDDEAAAPQIWPPMAHRKDEPDELSLIRREGAVSGHHWPAEERDGVALLDEHGPKHVGGGVALNDEQLSEVRQREYRGGRHSFLEGAERDSCRIGPSKPLLFQERRERGSHGELPVVAGQAKEVAHCPCRPGNRPVADSLDLGRVHGDAGRRDDVSLVPDRGRAEGALGVLDEEVVARQLVEDDTEVSQVVRPSVTIY